MPTYLYNGQIIKGLSLATWEGFLDAQIDKDAEDLSAADVCRAVAWVYRCILLRADAIAGVPKGMMRGETPLEEWPESDWRQVLWRASISLDLYGAS